MALADVTRMLEAATALESEDTVAGLRSQQRAWATAIRNGVAELEERRRGPVATGPGVEERLERYRAAALGGLLASPGAMTAARRTGGGQTLAQWIADEAEAYAHAMLAAEHPAADNEPALYNLAYRHGQESGHAAGMREGARAVLDALAGLVAASAPRTPEEWAAVIEGWRRDMRVEG